MNENDDIFNSEKRGIGHVNHINKTTRRASTDKKKN